MRNYGDVRLDLPDVLRGERVLLRRLQVADVGPYVKAFRDDPDLGRLVGMEKDPTEESIRRRVEAQVEAVAQGRGVDLAIADAATGAFWGALADQHRA